MGFGWGNAPGLLHWALLTVASLMLEELGQFGVWKSVLRGPWPLNETALGVRFLSGCYSPLPKLFLLELDCLFLCLEYHGVVVLLLGLRVLCGFLTSLLLRERMDEQRWKV